jgi:NADH:ubiquinone oxidoreductase subunit 2 (subunit N)
MTSSNPDRLTPRSEHRDSFGDVLPLKPLNSSVAHDRDRQVRPQTMASRMAQFPFLARFAVINLVGVALLGAAWAEDLLLKPYRADGSGMCYLITALFLAGMVAITRKDWQTVRWTGNTLVYLGMVGTVLGLIMTVSDLSVDKAQSFESFKAIVTAIYVGAGTALYTNLLACIGYLWLGTNAHLLARQEV